MAEYGFELALCAHLERPDRIVARQLGASVHGRRIVDTVLLEPGPAFEQRAAITARTIPPALIEADLGPGRARPRSEVLPDVHPERAGDLIEAGVEAGFLERERRGGRSYLRQTTRYPDDWVGRLVGVENKPDLDRPGDLQAQLRTDVSLGLFDEVVLATADYVTGAHRNRLPDAVGVWRFDPHTAEREVVREPTPLAPDEPGIEPVERHPGRTEVAVATAEQKARARRRLAERAYGKGWRPGEWPACRQCRPGAGPVEASVPYCAWADGIVDPATDCGPDCPGHEPADAPELDRERERAAASAWVADPEGVKRRQARLDRFD